MERWKDMKDAPRDRPVIVGNGKHFAIAQWRKLTFDEGFVMEGAVRPFWPGNDSWRWAEIPAWEE